ncbi:uncharacterized protein A4U43_C02F8350 [Asparagus officinalis]|uniref:ribonuclease P n=1 Tax=Asparagus officinalis TaxID=4686 RepID=A0A5P1FKX5_ASPOF|nr:proteinaceous RNase P 2 [Asparagus officinalis]ONK77599.1 uncharacterized protein A4U43_C02F8350 [Asparagus officinalis]
MKKKNHRPEAQFRHDLDTCSKNKDLNGALDLYQSALSSNFNLSSYHYNTLLHLCSSSIETLDPSSKQSKIGSSFEIFNRMIESGIVPNEATITTMARIAVQKSEGGGDLAFDLVKTMKGKYGAVPRLRTFGPAIFSFCNGLEAEKAYEVENHMISMGVSAEESEIAALLKVSAKKGKGEKVYEYLLKLRNCAGSVNSSTAEILENWFTSDIAVEFGAEEWDLMRIRDVISMNGGGWHGLGWLGKGRWDVKRGNVSSNGECSCCRQRLACVDVEEKEAEKFVESVASLAMERETKSNFKIFQEWLEKRADYGAIVDGANIALYQQNFADGGFSLSQLDAVVRELYKRNQSKWPLVILHNKRYRALMENPSNRQLLDTWRAEGALYTTPNGSNDDWYWLYAAVKLKCLLVTNDEMRDHIFEILGRSFFPKWKDRHQVRYTFAKGNFRLTMPPPYSIVIQESETGSWHVPVENRCSDESTRDWLCITRPESHNSGKSTHAKAEEMHDAEKFTAENVNGVKKSSSELQSGVVIPLTGKRKERSPSPSKPPAG